MKAKKAFTLIELLVVIAIIGLLATISVIALNNARAKARDAKRIADVKQVQTALELYYNDKGHYPATAEFTSGSLYSTSTNGTTTYMEIIPAAPNQADGSCTDPQNQFVYTKNGNDYAFSFCLGGPTGSLAAGPKCATSAGILNQDCSPGGTNSVVTYALRDTGPAGGIIFYENPNYATDGWRYLEAAPMDQTIGTWGCSGTTITGADGVTVGTGNQNTLDIINGCSTPGIAARNTRGDIMNNGHTDWFLPSKDELNLMYINLRSGIDEFNTHYTPVGNFSSGGWSGAYWSSSEYSSALAWYQRFTDGGQNVANPYRYDQAYVRAIRAF